MWLMKASKNFEKIFILKIWELVSIWGVKTHFGLLPPKWCIFSHEKKHFNQHYVLALHPIWILTYYAPQNDRLDLSFVKDCHIIGKSMTKNGYLWVIDFQDFLFQNGNRTVCVLCCSFWSNQDLDMFSTSKWLSTPNFFERLLCSWQKNDQKWS